MKLGALGALGALALLVVTGPSEGRRMTATDVKAEIQKEVLKSWETFKNIRGKVPVSAPVRGSASVRKLKFVIL